MAFCTEPWAAEMPVRTKAQRAARLARAREEAELMRQRYDLYYEMYHSAMLDYYAAIERRDRMKVRA